MYSTNKTWFKIVSFILAFSFVISSFSTVGKSVSNRTYDSHEVSVIKPDIPRYSAENTSDMINVLKDVTNSDEETLPDTPLGILNYIRTHISSDLGIAFRRDADAVRKAGRATASENANLLAEMLREQGYEVKFVHGQAVFKEQQVKWLTGASSIDKGADVYKENGIKYTKLLSDGKTIGLIVEHIWVRAYLPVTDYRGAKDNAGEYAWIDLDAYAKNQNLSQVDTLTLLPFSLQFETRGLNGSGEPKVTDTIPEELKKVDNQNPSGTGNPGGTGSTTETPINEDSTGLTALMEYPEDEDTITALTDIVGTVCSDAENVEYTLGYRPNGKGDYKIFYEGKESVNKGKLGSFDPSLLANGKYQIRLSVKDGKGHSKTVTRKVNIEGALKVGNMHIGFTDITSKITGTTVNVNRIYDSTVKESGDFGYGWSMSVQGLKIYESASLAEGYGMVQSGSGFSTRYQMVEKKDHDVTVTYGDGTSDRFELTFSPAMGVLRPIQEVSLGYKCVTNQKVKLEILTDTSGAVSGGNILFYENGVYDTINYRLTTENGEKLYLNKNKGVYRIEDSLGHKITVDANGYHGEDGRSIEVKRDSKNRVTEAIDVNGNKTIYKYDAAGDLISVTDSADRTVSYTYDKNHNLISIIDPMGVAVSRNEYDDEGRLVASIDADGNRMEFSHDVEGRSEIIKDRRGNATQYVYDDNGNVIQTKDPYGNVTKNEYDANNNCISKTDAKGHTTGFSYDANGNCTKVTAPDGTVVENSYSEENYVTGIKMLDKTVMAMTYDSTGYLKSLTDANGNEMDYDYSKDGQLIGMTDSIGVYQKMTYDSEGNVLSTTNGAGESAYYTYDDNGRCTGVTIKRTEEGKEISFTSRYTYDDADNVVQSVDNSGNVTTYEYDKDGNQVASVDAKNRRISYEYDNQANLIKTVYPDGTSESFEYDANGNNVTAMDRSGLKVTMEYDKLDRLVSKTYADGNKESYKYDAVGNLIEQTSITGARTTYAYDECDRNISITDTFGRKTTFAYDSQSKLISRTDCKNNKTTYTYDDNGNITKTTYPDGFSVTAQYDARNRIVSQADQNGYTTKYEYDAADKLTKVTDANGNIYTYSYDENGNLVKVTDPLNHSTEYTYDAVGHVASVKNAAGKVAEYDYDSTGKLVSEKDYAGNRTEYSYDDMDRVSSKKTADNEITYTYTDEGLLSAVKDKSGTVSYKYDKYNRLTAYTNAENITVSYEYDKYGNVSAIDNGFKKTQYEYDKRNRLTRVIDHNGKATVYEYDELGNRSALRYPNGDVVTYTYDKCQRLKTELIKDSSGKQIAKYTYTLGKAGERTRVDEEELSADTDSEGNEATVKTQISYTYDRSYRLTREVISRGRPYLNIQYSYDKASNRTMKYVSVNGDISLFADVDLDEIDVKTGKTNYTFNELNQLLSAKTDSGETTAYTYDDNGNLIKEQGEKTKDYKYDSENHLVSATVQQGNSLTSEDYTYDYAGNRTSKIVNELDVTKYVNDIYSDLTYVLAETDKDGKLKKSYTRGDELISSEIGTQSSGNNSQNTSTQNGTTNSTVRYFINDGHGSVRYLTDSEGKVTDRYTYDGYGNLLEKEGDTENDFLYTGEQYNYTTELYYLRARYMDPSTGTFISMDSYAGSLSDPISLHKYLYCHANPIMNTDPSGNHISVSQLAVGMGLNISEINAEVVRNAILIRTLKGAAIGAVAGAVLGGIDSALSGNGIKQVLFDTIKGALGGMCVGAVIAIALIYATVSLPVFISLKIFSYGMLITGALGVVIAAKDDNIPLALFRAITTLVSFFGFSSVLKNIKFTSWTDPSEHYLHRPYIRKGTMDAINEKTRVDYETGEIYDAISNKWVDPSEVELGHTKGNEFWYWRNWAERHGMTQADFNDFMNNPDFYAWQDIICNRSHQFEDSH